MAGSDEEDQPRSGDWPWNNQTFQKMQAEHERFMRELGQDEQRLQRRIESEITAYPSTAQSPFTGFKKFIDDSFHTFTESLKNFPANLAEIRENMEHEREGRQTQESVLAWYWTQRYGSWDEIRDDVEQSTPVEKELVRDATLMLLRESWRRNQHVPTEKILALYADPQSRFGDLDRFAGPMLSWGGACYYKPETGGNLPSTRSWSWTSRPTPRWLSVEWFKRSPYCPIALENGADTGESGIRWRSAFEDLLNASLDKPMSGAEQVGVRPPYGTVQSTWHGPGLDWMLSLQCRGILPPQLPRLYNDPRATRGTYQKSIIDLIERGTTGASLFGFASPLEHDFSDLMAEVAIKKAPPRIAMIPRTLPEKPQICEPTTELDLYEPCEPQRDLHDFQMELEERLDDGGVKAVVDLFHEYSRDHTDFHALMENICDEDTDYTEAAKTYLPTLLSALRQCSPKVTGDENVKFVVEWLDKVIALNQGSPAEIQRRRRALDRLAAVELEPFNMDAAMLTTEEIEQWVKELEKDNLMDDDDAEERVEDVPEAEEEEEASPLTSLPKRFQAIPSQNAKPDVLSVLTTTQTTRSADGTVTTKVVLKRRFADGSEESHESLHTEHGSAREQNSQDEKPTDAKKKGWFWS